MKVKKINMKNNRPIVIQWDVLYEVQAFTNLVDIYTVDGLRDTDALARFGTARTIIFHHSQNTRYYMDIKRNFKKKLGKMETQMAKIGCRNASPKP